MNTSASSRYQIELLEDTHIGTGYGGLGVDAVYTRDRKGHPVIRWSHLKGLLREALADSGTAAAESDALFGSQSGKDAGSVVLTSAYLSQSQQLRNEVVWGSSARGATNRAPQEDTLRSIEYLPAGTCFAFDVRLPNAHLELFGKAVLRLASLGHRRQRGAGRVRITPQPAADIHEGTPSHHVRLLLQALDPVCVPKTGVPNNLVASESFIRGPMLFGALTGLLRRKNLSCCVPQAISPAWPLPWPTPIALASLEALPLPLVFRQTKPQSVPGWPWWANAHAGATELCNQWQREEKPEPAEKLQRANDHSYLCGTGQNFIAYQPDMVTELRSGRAQRDAVDPALFSIEAIAEGTSFVCDLRFADVATAERFAQSVHSEWLTVGRAGRPVQILQACFMPDPQDAKDDSTATLDLVLVSDLIVQDQHAACFTRLDLAVLTQLGAPTHGLKLEKSISEHFEVRDFNSASGLPRPPALAIVRGSVLRVSGDISALHTWLTSQPALGQRQDEGFGRFRLGIPTLATGSSSISEAPADPGEALCAAAKPLAQQFEPMKPHQMARLRSLGESRSSQAKICEELGRLLISEQQNESVWANHAGLKQLLADLADQDDRTARRYLLLLVRYADLARPKKEALR